MFEAQTIMNTNVISVKKDTPIYDAIRLLVDNNITGLPVVNDDMTLCGIISEKDVLRLLYEIEDKQDTVESFMTPSPIVFKETDTIMDICNCLINNHFRRVPIVRDGKLAGIVSRKDIIKFILEFRKK